MIELLNVAVKQKRDQDVRTRTMHWLCFKKGLQSKVRQIQVRNKTDKFINFYGLCPCLEYFVIAVTKHKVFLLSQKEKANVQHSLGKTSVELTLMCNVGK